MRHRWEREEESPAGRHGVCVCGMVRVCTASGPRYFREGNKTKAGVCPGVHDPKAWRELPRNEVLDAWVRRRGSWLVRVAESNYATLTIWVGSEANTVSIEDPFGRLQPAPRRPGILVQPRRDGKVIPWADAFAIMCLTDGAPALGRRG